MDHYISVLSVLFVITILYVAILERLHDLYTPRWTWLTVVIGNALIGFAVLVLCLLGDLPMAAFWTVLAANVTAGIPVVTWQLAQNTQRRRELRAIKERGAL